MRFLRQRFVDGRLRYAARPAYALAVGLELAAQRALDTARPARGGRDAALLAQLTALVKTFERPGALKRLVASIQRLYPELHTIVVDDSREPTRLPGVNTIVLPYDSGLSAGRSEGLRAVTTRYVLNLDDDFVFTRHTALRRALAIMEAQPQIDIMGGEVVHLPFFHRTDYSQAPLFPTPAAPTLPAGSQVGGLPVYDKVADFFIGRTERLRLVDWGPELKRVVHADFFTRARGVLTSVFNPDLKVVHAPTPFDAAYMEKRLDVDADYRALRQRYYRR